MCRSHSKIQLDWFCERSSWWSSQRHRISHASLWQETCAQETFRSLSQQISCGQFWGSTSQNTCLWNGKKSSENERPSRKFPIIFDRWPGKFKNSKSIPNHKHKQSSNCRTKKFPLSNIKRCAILGGRRSQSGWNGWFYSQWGKPTHSKATRIQTCE